jgi:hypothetical protein
LVLASGRHGWSGLVRWIGFKLIYKQPLSDNYQKNKKKPSSKNYTSDLIDVVALRSYWMDNASSPTQRQFISPTTEEALPKSEPLPCDYW